MTADFIDGKEAERIGLVSLCVPRAELLAKALATADKLGRRQPARHPLDQALAEQLDAPCRSPSSMHRWRSRCSASWATTEGGHRRARRSASRVSVGALTLPGADAKLGEVAINACEIRHRPQLRCGFGPNGFPSRLVVRFDEIEVAVDPLFDGCVSIYFFNAASHASVGFSCGSTSPRAAGEIGSSLIRAIAR